MTDTLLIASRKTWPQTVAKFMINDMRRVINKKGMDTATYDWERTVILLRAVWCEYITYNQFKQWYFKRLEKSTGIIYL